MLNSQGSDYPSDRSLLLITGWGERLGQTEAGSCLEMLRVVSGKLSGTSHSDVDQRLKAKLQ